MIGRKRRKDHRHGIAGGGILCDWSEMADVEEFYRDNCGQLIAG